MNRTILLTALMVLLPVMRAQSAAPAGNVEDGKRLYLKNGCYECHGTVGQGAQANPVAPRLAPKPLSLAALIAYVRKPAGTMPPYVSKVMSDAELADVRAYLASIPEPPPLKSIASLNQ
jgi:ubiquinol-cytochrome c reductase cytochrome c subunit